jgi:hypothetical protein
MMINLHDIFNAKPTSDACFAALVSGSRLNLSLVYGVGRSIRGREDHLTIYNAKHFAVHRPRISTPLPFRIPSESYLISSHCPRAPSTDSSSSSSSSSSLCPFPLPHSRTTHTHTLTHPCYLIRPPLSGRTPRFDHPTYLPPCRIVRKH